MTDKDRWDEKEIVQRISQRRNAINRLNSISGVSKHPNRKNTIFTVQPLKE